MTTIMINNCNYNFWHNNYQFNHFQFPLSSVIFLTIKCWKSTSIKYEFLNAVLISHFHAVAKK